MEANHTNGAPPSEQPFPLQRLFVRRFVPAFVGFIGLFLILIGTTAWRATESIYLELAQRRAQNISRAVALHAPAPWQDLMTGKSFAELGSTTAILVKAFTDEVQELNLSELKVYDLNRRVLFATHAKEIGTFENGDALRAVIARSEPEIATKDLADGTRQYELYVPVFDNAGHLRAVFELYEPVGYLDDILTRSAFPAVAVPGILLIVLALALNGLVRRAQTDIDQRTSALNALRQRIETFVSATTVDAARTAGTGGDIESRKITTTLLFSDIRDFTSYAEQNTPEDVVDFLNELMTIQVDAIARHGGDIDKMIGDAVLARFDGSDGVSSAISAARDIQHSIKQSKYPRGIGIGVYRGEVVSGAIGPESRRDYTVIGDTVNIAARLCSAAKIGEIVTEAAFADNGFGPVESIQVKGRREAINIRRSTL